MESEVNKQSIRSERKTFLQIYVITQFFIILTMASSELSHQEDGWLGFTYLSLAACIAAIFLMVRLLKHMNVLVEMLYEKPKSKFVFFVALFISGIIVGIFGLIPPFILWFKARKMLI